LETTFGESQSSGTATAQSTYCSVPPAIPPASTSAAPTRLTGAMRRMLRTTDCDVERVKSHAWTTTMAA